MEILVCFSLYHRFLLVDDPQLDQQLRTARQQSQQYRSLLEQLSTRLNSRRESLRLQENITSDLQTLV